MDQPEPPAGVDETPHHFARGPAPLKHASSRFFNDPASGRKAIALIVVADLVIVLVGGVILWFVDRAEYAQISNAFWYILQTITTVGYGDATPTEPIGRLVGALFMMLGIAFLSILTASITSAFIDARQAARREQNARQEDARWERLDARIDVLIERLDRIEGAGAAKPDPE